MSASDAEFSEDDLSEILSNSLRITDASTSAPISNVVLNNSGSTSNNTQIVNTMARINFDVNYLKCIPDFDGRTDELPRFLSTCQQIMDTFYDAANPQAFLNTFIVNSIINKLRGNARIVANIQKTNTWDELKRLLIRNFADQRNEQCLSRDLHNLRQAPNEPTNKFYDRVLHLLNILSSHIEANEAVEATKLVKKTLYSKQALTSFLCGLREPLGSTIRTMRPDNLAVAMQYVQECENISYFQKQNFPIQKPVVKPQNNFSNVQPRQNLPFPQQNPNFSNFSQAQNYQYNQMPHNQSRFLSQPVNVQPRPINQRFPTNSQVFGKPQNVFKPRGIENQYKPTPMSITSRNSSVPKPNYPNHNQNQRNFQSKHTAEEIHNTEIYEEEPQPEYCENYPEEKEYYEHPDYPQENISETPENFQLESQPPPQT